ncbi:MAG: SagB/ThcOx family dehydrogenase [Cytophagaceae bacterium]|jgi:SagB-type dehydrogenase family enzyme|nr:SagB/ThcOx family dehydrogenase [Cytophagaceae bacterium]
MKKGFLIIGLLCFTAVTHAQEIKLNAPSKKGGKPLMEVVNGRHSERSFVKKEMPAQILSDLLWVANGFNRNDKRTVPTAQDRQEMELYVMLDDGVYFYDAKANVLKPVQKGNFRKALGQENITSNAAVNLIMVGDLSKAASREYAYFAAGCISQNVYLYAESKGLGTVARGSFNRDELTKALKLSEKKEVMLVQPVGWIK